MSGRDRPLTQPGETAVFAQLVVFPAGPQQTSLPSLVFQLLLKLLFYSFLKMLSHLMSTDPLLGACCKLHNGSGVAKLRLVSSSSANLCTSFTSEQNPFSPAF